MYSCWECKIAFKEPVIEIEEDIDFGDKRETRVCPFCMSNRLEDGIQTWIHYVMAENGDKLQIMGKGILGYFKEKRNDQ